MKASDRLKEDYTRKSFKEMKEMSKGFEPVLRLGKNGITEGVLKEINEQLKKRHLIKIKMLPAFLDMNNRRTVPLEIAKKTNSKLVQQVGGAIVLYRR